MSRNYIRFGPPGAGKTTRLIADVAKAVEKFGKNKVLVTSFTKAAAVEIAERGAAADKSMCGTLHSICYRGLGNPMLAEEFIGEFNAEHPAFAISEQKPNLDDGLDQPEADGRADRLHRQAQLLRARMVPVAGWPESVQGFHRAWEGFKAAHDLLDYTDLIDYGAKNFTSAPGTPAVMFVDEAQDLSALQFHCISQWSKGCEFTVYAGDDDQAIYDFTGADAANLLGVDCPEENRTVLKESHRLPRAVHAWANGWIAAVGRRQAKEYRPRDEEGEVVRLRGANWRAPQAVLDDMEARLAEGQTCMALAACGYMLGPLLQIMRERGVPFHNPWRRSRGDWNPIAREAEGSTAKRLLSFLRADEGRWPHWTAKNLKLWTDLVRAKGVLAHGAKAEIERWADALPAAEVKPDHMRQYLLEGPWDFPEDFTPQAAARWLAEHATEGKKRALEFACAVVERGGEKALKEAPRVAVGTIHSVKGAQADCVWLIPDLSRDAYSGMRNGGEAADAVRRVFYVGATRAFRRLALVAPASAMSVRL